jgi:hypothetical protein
MTDSPRHVLVVGADEPAVERVAPMLRRAEFEVHTVAPSSFVLDLVLGTSFELLIVSYPLPTDLPVDNLLAAVRQDGSLCRSSGVLLLAAPGHVEAAAGWVDQGANRVVGSDWADARLWQAVGDLLKVAPRVALRALVQVDLDRRSGRDAELLRTENVSASGMLLRGARGLGPGTRFEFMLGLPGETAPIRGQAEVVRHAPELAGEDGFGVRFVGFSGEGQTALERYIARRMST